MALLCCISTKGDRTAQIVRIFDLSPAAKINMFLWILNIDKGLIKESVYFKRPWTFQEWATARDVRIALEDGDVLTFSKLFSASKSPLSALLRERPGTGQYSGIAGRCSTCNMRTFQHSSKKSNHYFPMKISFCPETRSTGTSLTWNTEFQLCLSIIILARAFVVYEGSNIGCFLERLIKFQVIVERQIKISALVSALC